jgi:hypothetical protein
VLRLEVLSPVFSDHLHRGFGQDAELLGRDVLRRGDDGHARTDLRSDPLVPLSDLLR